MGHLIGICNIGPFMTKRYIDRYGLKTKWAKQFHGKKVLVRTNGGLWREGAQGYTSSPADAGRFSLETAWDCIKDLGPEKYASIVLPEKVTPKKRTTTFLVEVKATIEVEACGPNEAGEIADLLAAPLTVPQGVVVVGPARLPEEDHDG